MKIVALLVLVLMAGCKSVPDFVVYPAGQRITVKSGYELPGRKIGDEFVFSVVLPDDEWSYYPKSNGPVMG
ncbi:MAG: hypothetical protein Q8J78_05750, partial [Moraxellaceae bacterium]|nr:hypothetical protein [Moraxellaceae bacterium]